MRSWMVGGPRRAAEVGRVGSAVGEGPLSMKRGSSKPSSSAPGPPAPPRFARGDVWPGSPTSSINPPPSCHSPSASDTLVITCDARVRGVGVLAPPLEAPSPVVLHVRREKERASDSRPR